jgi:hypothetical protein
MLKLACSCRYMLGSCRKYTAHKDCFCRTSLFCDGTLRMKEPAFDAFELIVLQSFWLETRRRRKNGKVCNPAVLGDVVVGIKAEKFGFMKRATAFSAT